MSESHLLQRIRLKASQIGWRLFRNNVGVAWAGKPCIPCMQRMVRIRYGLCVGSSDLIGWRPITITQQMVGTTVAIFLAVEVKTPSGRVSDEQNAFLDAVTASGGDARVVRFEEQIFDGK